MQLAALLIGGLGMLVLLEAIIRSTFVGTTVVLVAAALTTTLPALPDLVVGGTRIGMRDMVGTLLLAAASARLLRSREVSSLQWLLMGAGVLAFASAAQGIVEYDFNTALNEFRKYFWFFSVALYFTTVQPQRDLLDRLARAWLLLASFVVLLSLMRWVAQPLGVQEALFGTFKGHEAFRVVHAIPTLVAFQGFVIGALAWARGDARSWMRRLTPVLLGLVVLMQHRTVWAVALVTITVMILLERQFARKLVPLIVLATFTLIAFSLTILDDQATDLSAQLAESAASRGTWEWRIEGWRALIVQGPQGAAEIMIGQPFGGGWDRFIDGSVVSVSPHNFFVETYLRTGLLGLGLLASLYVVTLWRLGTGGAWGGLLGRRVLFLLLLTHPIFFIPYAPAPEQGLVLGLAIAAAGAMRGPSIDATQVDTVLVAKP